MSILEIENAIQKLPPRQLEELFVWLEALRVNRDTSRDADKWLQQARGAAQAGQTTAGIMSITRGEE